MAYKYIVNPKTNKKCKTTSTLGKSIILKYTSQLGGAETKTEDPLIQQLITIGQSIVNKLEEIKNCVCKENDEGKQDRPASQDEVQVEAINGVELQQIADDVASTNTTLNLIHNIIQNYTGDTLPVNVTAVVGRR